MEQRQENQQERPFNYYKSQLSRLTDLFQVGVKLVDYSGNSTNYMNLNHESIDEIISFLTELKKTTEEKK